MCPGRMTFTTAEITFSCASVNGPGGTTWNAYLVNESDGQSTVSTPRRSSPRHHPSGKYSSIVTSTPSRKRTTSMTPFAVPLSL